VRPAGEVDDIKTVRLLLVLGLHEDHEGCVASVASKVCDLTDGVFVPFEAGGAADVFTVWEEGCQDVGVGVEGAVEGGCDEDFGLGGRVEELSTW
jgi:hypothetical protein